MVVMHGNVVLGTKSLLLYVIEMRIWEGMMKVCNMCIKLS